MERWSSGFEDDHMLHGEAMSNKKTTPERLSAFSDGVFNVIIDVQDR
jgi:hypothetical protein